MRLRFRRYYTRIPAAWQQRRRLRRQRIDAKRLAQHGAGGLLEGGVQFAAARISGNAETLLALAQAFLAAKELQFAALQLVAVLRSAPRLFGDQFILQPQQRGHGEHTQKCAHLIDHGEIVVEGLPRPAKSAVEDFKQPLIGRTTTVSVSKCD